MPNSNLYLRIDATKFLTAICMFLAVTAVMSSALASDQEGIDLRSPAEIKTAQFPEENPNTSNKEGDSQSGSSTRSISYDLISRISRSSKNPNYATNLRFAESVKQGTSLKKHIQINDYKSGRAIIPFINKVPNGAIKPFGFSNWLVVNTVSIPGYFGTISDIQNSSLADINGIEFAKTDKPIGLAAADTFPSNNNLNVLASYYAGIIYDNPDDPRNPKIDIGTVSWLDTRNSFRPSDPEGLNSNLVAQVMVEPAKVVAQISICCKPELGKQKELYLNLRFFTRSRDLDIQEVEAPALRQSGNISGDPLVAKVETNTANSFRVLLSNMPGDYEHNLRLLYSRAWIDIPLHFRSGNKAILTLTLGKIGADVLEKALN